MDEQTLPTKVLRIGTRGSRLAMIQAEQVASSLIKALPDMQVELIPITTSGDKKQKSEKETVRDKKEWVLEIEEALLRRDVDCAVHSAKDVPADIEPGTVLVPIGVRANPLDALVLRETPGESPATSAGAILKTLPEKARVGTTSKRRRAQLLALRSDLEVVPFRGNVPTRLRKLRERDEVEAMIIACAGLERLGLSGEISGVFTANELVPAVNQGILVAQYQSERRDVSLVFSSLIDHSTRACFLAERSFVSEIGADCNSAVGVYACMSGDELRVAARVLSPDGAVCLEERISGAPDPASELGRRLAGALLERGAGDLL